ncbi:spore germination protein [Bacillus sp. 165]|uniref:spore germination protein n=1 Tax=Bacillus sp. 165 TaxID=1529117 RepID=UPI001ADA5F3D|nr:spore germination protein [Bacillus sp. 165]MBO9129638.1 spore germination protein [Bacillus sp. 165]
MEKKHLASKSIDPNIVYMNKQLRVDENFDVIQKNVEYAHKRMSFFYIDGFVKDDMLLYIMQYLSKLEESSLQGHTIEGLINSYIPYVEVEQTDDLETAIRNVLAGQTALIVDGEEHVILIDARTYPVRGPQEPDTEKVVRGARDGYVETIVFNTSLTRRRVRDRSLRMDYMQIGRRSQTDICICYIEDIADPKQVEMVKESLKKIDTDGLPMGEKTLEEFISGRHWNPYPVVRYTERPDTAAAHLYDGHVLVITDGSPSVMITPSTYWNHLQHAEEYRNKPVVGAYLRLVRFLAVWSSVFLLPFWYLLSVNQGLLPSGLSFIGPDKLGSIPLFVQFLLIEIGIDALRMATIHTPSSLSSSLGLVAAIVIGQGAVEVGFFINEVIVYLAIAAVGTFATPSYELGLANRLTRLALLTLSAAFGVIGYIIGITIWILWLAGIRSFKMPYLWPFLPFSYRALRDVIIRSPLPLKNRRPTALHPQDPDR